LVLKKTKARNTHTSQSRGKRRRERRGSDFVKTSSPRVTRAKISPSRPSRVSPDGRYRDASGGRFAAGGRVRAGRTLMPVTSISISVLWSTKGGASR
jgi:hypothetical protein